MRKSMLVVAAIAAYLLAPTSASAQAGGSVCKDGTKSTATGQGACSNHGGVDADATKKMQSGSKSKSQSNKSSTGTGATAAKGEGQSDKAEGKHDEKSEHAKSGTKDKDDDKGVKGDEKGDKDSKNAEGATARCKDGTYSHSKTHQGACSKHGGVDQWMDGSKSKG